MVMKSFLVIEKAVYGVSLKTARRLTDEEKTGYAEWYQDIGMISLSESIDLPMLKWDDMPKRPRDGEFLGCSNQAWIITQEEWDNYIALNAARQDEKRKKEEAEKRLEMLDVIEKAKMQGGAYSVEEAKRRATAWNNAVNEGGEGFVPHYVTIPEFEYAQKWLTDHPEN